MSTPATYPSAIQDFWPKDGTDNTAYALPHSGVSGRYLDSDLIGELAVYPLAGNTNGVRITLAGVGADNATITGVRVYAYTATFDPASLATAQGNCELFYLGLLTGTLSAGAIEIADTGGNEVKPCDTMTWTEGTAATTPKGVGDAVRTAYGAAAVQVFSPADDASAACAVFPTVAWAQGLVLDWDLGTATRGYALITKM